MSSSVFFESSSTAPRKQISNLTYEENLIPRTASDSDLVVVYGKNGITFDRRGLETLIEEKALSSISVLRITSPTPSMLEAEEEYEKEEEALRRQEMTTDDDSQTSVCSDSEKNEPSTDEERSVGTNEDGDTNSEDDKSSENAKTKRKQKRRTRKKASKNTTKTERPDVVGLTVEEFYTQEEATKLAHKVLGLVGISTLKEPTTDKELQLYVIKNDHCYTPFLSPSQKQRQKESEMMETEDELISMPETTTQRITSMTRVKQNKQIKQIASKNNNNNIIKQQQNAEKSKSAAGDEDEKEVYLLSDYIESDSDYEESNPSAESENDRDSDLDFRINNQGNRGRKQSLHKKVLKRTASKPSAINVRRQQSQEHLLENRVVEKTKTKTNEVVSRLARPLFPTSTSAMGAKPSTTTVAKKPSQQVMHPTNVTKTVVFHQQNIQQTVRIIKKVNVVTEQTSVVTTTQNKQQIPHPMAANIRKGPVLKVGVMPRKVQTPTTPQQQSQQNVKEILLNKVVSSPKGGFTEISTFLKQTDKQHPKPTIPMSSLSTMRIQQRSLATTTTSNTSSTSKGFVVLGLDAANKRELPSQISIETHQSSSELAAEHDKQLDLIDSIVQDEMQKANILVQQPAASGGANENIPKLVEMLEGSEKQALESLKSTNVENIDNVFIPTESVDDIDIANAALLNAHEHDELPEDLLQHVAEFIQDDKTLEEAVEKNFFSDQNHGNEDSVINVTNISNMINVSSVDSVGVANENVQPTTAQLAPIFQEALQQSTEAAAPDQTLQKPKSIIELAITNSPSPSSPDIFGDSPRIEEDQTPKLPHNILPEPLKVQRGNGRVITLPPIEMPNTRAKRRAQQYPKKPNTNAFTPNSSVNQSPVSTPIVTPLSTPVTTPISTPISTPPASISIASEKKIAAVPTPANKKNASKETAASAAKSAKKGSARKGNSAAKGRAANRVAGRAKVEKVETEEDTAESQDDDDDPNKLWCICRQPHNNRFMICCDACEDWFHGTCVNVTKAMGLDMEQKGIDWKCPICTKKEAEKNQPKITDMLVTKKTTTVTKTVVETKTQEQTTTSVVSTVIPVNPVTIETPSFSIVARPATPQIISHMEPKKVHTTTGNNNMTNQSVMFTSPSFTSVGQKKSFGSPAATSQLNKTPTTQSGQPVRKREKIHIQKIEILPPATIRAPMTPPVPQPVISAAPAPPPQAPPTPQVPKTFCVSCKKQARPKTVYCSDECIRKYAQSALNILSAKQTPESPSGLPGSAADEKKKKGKGLLFEEILSAADRKPKFERVNVYDRKKSLLLTGSNAPTTIYLRKWLQENPTFEVVLPGTPLYTELEKKEKLISLHGGNSPAAIPQAKKILMPSAAQSPKGVIPKLQSPLVQKAEEKPHTDLVIIKKPVKPTTADQQKPTTSNSSQSTPRKPLTKQPASPASASAVKSEPKEQAKPKEKTLKRQSSESNKKKDADCEAASSSHMPSDPEPIRNTVRRNLKDLLQVRMTEATKQNATKDIPILTSDEIEEFVEALEMEMYKYFNGDCSMRYKAKFRSFMFNLSDRKNQTLFMRICLKEIDPKDFVTMSSEELASKELKGWRENENKHQLELIKNSELVKLSCTKNVVLKTHKGEEIIEGKPEDQINLDLTTPVEDVVSMLNISTGTTINDMNVALETTPQRKLHLEFDGGLSSAEKEKDLKIEKSAEKILEKSTEKTAEKSVENSAEKTVEKSPEKSDDKAIDKSVEKSVEKSEKTRSTRDKDKDREKDKEHDRGHRRSSDTEKRHTSKEGRDHHHSHHHHHHHQSDKSHSTKRSHSRSRSKDRERERDRERDRKKHKSHHKDESRSRRDKDSEHSKEHSKEREQKSDDDKNKRKSSLSASTKTSTALAVAGVSTKKPTVAVESAKKPTAIIPVDNSSFNLVDQILESEKTVEEAANLVTEKPKENTKQKHAVAAAAAATVTKSPPSTSVTGTSPEATTSQPVVLTSAPPTPTFDANANTTNLEESDLETISLSPKTIPTSRRAGRSTSAALWTGMISMYEISSFNLELLPFCGNSVNIGKYLPEALEIVGRIEGPIVEDYLSKIKRSPNKEIVLVRLVPLNETENAAYTVLFDYLNSRSRLGVVKTSFPLLKDFYIFPLCAGKKLPSHIRPNKRVDFYENPYRPDILVGIMVRVVGKRSSSTHSGSSTSKFSRKINENSNSAFTPPGSPKRKKHHHVELDLDAEADIDVDAIIKGPITSKLRKPTSIPVKEVTEMNNDADEPYSPGGSSDGDTSLPPKPVPAPKPVDIQRQMEELNKQIAVREMEIALLKTDPPKFVQSASSFSDIKIPSDLPQILASIQGKQESVPILGCPPPPIMPTLKLPLPMAVPNAVAAYDSSKELYNKRANEKPSTSRLAQLSEAELLRMVPDNMMNPTTTTTTTTKTTTEKPTTRQAVAAAQLARDEEPPPPGVE